MEEHKATTANPGRGRKHSGGHAMQPSQRARQCQAPTGALGAGSWRRSDLEAVLPKPAHRARVQRHVAWRRLGLFAEGADALVRRPGVEAFPNDLALARMDRVD